MPSRGETWIKTHTGWRTTKTIVISKRNERCGGSRSLRLIYEGKLCSWIMFLNSLINPIYNGLKREMRQK